jgi:hypothetical protein
MKYTKFLIVLTLILLSLVNANLVLANDQAPPQPAVGDDEVAVQDSPNAADPSNQWPVVSRGSERRANPDGGTVTVTTTTRQKPAARSQNAANVEACGIDGEAAFTGAVLALTCTYEVDLSTTVEWDFAYNGQHLYHSLRVAYKRYVIDDAGFGYYGYSIKKVSTWWTRTSSTLSLTGGSSSSSRPYMRTIFNGVNCNNDYTENSVRSWVNNVSWSGNSTPTYATTTPSNWGMKSRAGLSQFQQDVFGYSQVRYNGSVVGETNPLFSFPTGFIP